MSFLERGDSPSSVAITFSFSRSHHRHARKTNYGILDLKFSPFDPGIVAVAGSRASIEMFAIDISRSTAITKVRSFDVSEPSILVLSLDWCSLAERDTRMALSLSDGHVAILNFNQEKYSLSFCRAHDLEAWCVAWDKEYSVLFSGGDDSRLAINKIIQQDEEQANEEGKMLTSVYRNAKLHNAGVTTILPIGTIDAEDQYVLTGSYDENLRVLRRPAGTNKWQAAAEFPLGGGVWRLKMLSKVKAGQAMESRRLQVLASCMHAGPKIVELQLSQQFTWSVRILAQFFEHESMNYASDAMESCNEDRDGKLVVVSSSFYDKKLCLWLWEHTRDE